MKTLNKTASHCGNLLLINHEWPMHLEYNELVLRQVAPEVYLTCEAAQALQQLLVSCKAANRIAPVSGYRSLGEQVQIYAASLMEHGEVFTRKYVAFPGCSEHHSGLAVDMALLQGEVDPLTPNFPDEGICEDFRQAAADFGFVERYSRGKEQITGIAHEPWHFRYVGLPHAPLMRELGVALEEYLAMLQDYSSANPYRYCYQGVNYEIYQAHQQQVMNERGDCQVSGDNTGGFILVRRS